MGKYKLPKFFIMNNKNLKGGSTVKIEMSNINCFSVFPNLIDEIKIIHEFLPSSFSPPPPAGGILIFCAAICRCTAPAREPAQKHVFCKNQPKFLPSRKSCMLADPWDL